MMREKNNAQPISVGINAAAEMTGLSPAHLRRTIARGELQVVRIGRRVLIQTAVFEAVHRARGRARRIGNALVMQFQEFVNKLPGAKQRAGAGVLAFCPAHDNTKTQSLSVSPGADRVLISCKGHGCSAEAITQLWG